MKKRFYVVLVGILLSSSIFAVEPKYTSLGFQFSVPMIGESASENGISTETNITSIGFGLHGLALYTDKIGFYENLELLFPKSIKLKIKYDKYNTNTYNLSRSDYDSLWGLAALLSPAFCIIQTEKILFTISPGIHYTMLFASASSVSTVMYLFGIGANVQNTFFFSTNGYFTIGFDIAYDFLGFTISNGESKSGNSNDFIFNPKIGMGFRFK